VATDDDDAATRAQMSWAGLRALNVVTADEGLVGYVASELAGRIHVLNIAPETARPHYRHLIRWEPAAWARGVADVHGLGAVVESAVAEPVPELLTPAEAAELLPTVNQGRVTNERMTVDGVDYNVKTGALYALYTPTRFLFAAQVRFEAARRRALASAIGEDADLDALKHVGSTVVSPLEKEWMAIRGLLPPAISINALGRDVSPESSVDPLPLARLQSNNRRPMPRRWTEALMLAHQAGWLRFIGPEPDAYVYRVEIRDLSDTARELAVAGEDVLPWLLGVADGRDAAGLGVRNADTIAYREQLG
jgi:hypothetical protein